MHHIHVRQALSVWGGQDSIFDGLTGAAQLDAHVRVTAGTDGYEMAADNWKAQLADLSIQGTATVSGRGADRPRYSATLSAAPVMVTG